MGDFCVISCLKRLWLKQTHLKLREFCFLLGLLVYTVGQFLIFIFFNDIDALHSQEPIDFAHWFMLIGALLLIPQIGNFPKTKLNLIGTPVLVIGIGLIIFVFILFIANEMDKRKKDIELFKQQQLSKSFEKGKKNEKS